MSGISHTVAINENSYSSLRVIGAVIFAGSSKRRSALGFVSRLRRYVQPYTSAGKGHGRRRNCPEHAAHRRSHRSEYNQRKARWGAFWEDRYHATAIEADVHLHRCLVYIDLNMVRAGVVNHPGQWKESGFREIQNPPKRYAIIDLQSLSELSGFADLRDFQTAHRPWVEQGLENGLLMRDDGWSESIAVGSLAFIDKVKSELGIRAAHRDVIEADGSTCCGSQQIGMRHEAIGNSRSKSA